MYDSALKILKKEFQRLGVSKHELAYLVTAVENMTHDQLFDARQAFDQVCRAVEHIERILKYEKEKSKK